MYSPEIVSEYPEKKPVAKVLPEGKRRGEEGSFSEAKLAKQKEGTQKDKATGGKQTGFRVQLFNRLAKKVRR